MIANQGRLAGIDGERLRLSLVLPAYNEQAGLRQAIAEADDALARLGGDYEILVIDDGSHDDTAAVARAEAARRPRVRVLRHATNRGYGAALRTGFEAARGDLVAFTDADCQFHLDDLALLLRRADEAPIVVGYRACRQDGRRRLLLSRGYNLLARTLLGTRARDIDCALKLFRREALRQVLPETNGFFVNTEMLTRAAQLGIGVVEVPVRHRPRLRGRSTVSLREVPRTLGQLLPFWWSRVLFPGSDVASGGREPPVEMRQRGAHAPPSLAVVLVLLVAGPLFFARLRAPLLEPQEARYAEVPRQMLEAGEWVVPRLHGQPYLDKPPLLYWSVMASYRVFGIHDWAARVVPGLAGVLTALAAYLWGKRTLGRGAGFCAALVLCLTPEFVYRGRMLTFDALLMLWVTAGLALAHVALASGRRWPWLLSACACGLGLLTKGPVAPALVAVPAFVVAWLDPRLWRPSWRWWAAYLGVALAVAAPWYVAVALREPAFAADFFWTHNVVRFVAPFDHAKPIWFYLPGLAVGLLPWVLLLPGLAGLLLARGATAGERRPAALGFTLASFAWALLFFSAAGCKRPTYLLPALPPLALALGWYLQQGAPAALWRRASLSAGAACAVVLGGGAALALAACWLGVIPPRAGYALAGAAVGGLAFAVLAAHRLAWRHTAAVTFAGLWLGVQHLLPAYNDLFSLRGQLRRAAGAPERGGRAVVCYPQRYDSVSFYLPRGELRVFGGGQRRELIAHLEQNPGTLLLVKSGPVLRELLAELPPGVEFRAREQRAAIVVGRVVRRGDEADRLLARERE